MLKPALRRGTEPQLGNGAGVDAVASSQSTSEAATADLDEVFEEDYVKLQSLRRREALLL